MLEVLERSGKTSARKCPETGKMKIQGGRGWLRQKKIVPEFRELSNPPGRLPLRPDLPVVLVDRPFLETIKEELAKLGANIKDVKRINVAYPHKHPKLFSDHYDSAAHIAENVILSLKDAAPHIDWVFAESLCETKHLNRSCRDKNQKSLYALTACQEYTINLDPALPHLPFALKDNQETEYFIVVDTCIEQGTTMANLVNFIVHNGGEVLAAVIGHSVGGLGCSLAQKSLEYDRLDTDTDSSVGAMDYLRSKCVDIFAGKNIKGQLSQKFTDAAKNTARLPALAKALAKAARASGDSYTPEKCLELFETRLEALGHSIYGLTNGECRRLIESLNGGDIEFRTTFKEFMKGLEHAAKKRQKPKASAPGLSMVA